MSVIEVGQCDLGFCFQEEDRRCVKVTEVAIGLHLLKSANLVPMFPVWSIYTSSIFIRSCEPSRYPVEGLDEKMIM